MTGDEIWMEGGIYWEGRDGADRTDVSIETSGRGTEDNPLTVVLHITSGNNTTSLCGITPDDLIRLGKWLVRKGRAVRQQAADSG